MTITEIDGSTPSCLKVSLEVQPLNSVLNEVVSTAYACSTAVSLTVSAGSFSLNSLTRRDLNGACVVNCFMTEFLPKEYLMRCFI